MIDFVTDFSVGTKVDFRVLSVDLIIHFSIVITRGRFKDMDIP